MKSTLSAFTLIFACSPGISAAFVPSIQVVSSSHVAFAQSSSSVKLNNEKYGPEMKKLSKWVQKSLVVPMILVGTLNINQPDVVLAAEGAREIADIAGSGLIFKDTLVVESFDDPKVQGVSLYISNFQRPLAERLKKGFFEDPSSAAVGCAKTGTVKIADNINTSKQGEEVFEESKSLFFKTLRVQRVYDKEKNTMVYVSFNTRINKDNDDNKSRFKSSICVVNLDEPRAVTMPSLETTVSE